MSTALITLGTLLATLAAAPVTATTEKENLTDTIRVLLLTGVDHPGHQWKKTTPVIRELLEEDPRFQVDIVENPDYLASDEIFEYDEIFLHFKNYKTLEHEEKAKTNLLKFVQEGKGLVAFHFACGAFEDWPEFREVIGRVWDRKTGHDPRGAFRVNLTEVKHPITQGMSDFDAFDELYICLEGDRKVDLLATARSKKTGKDHPMAFTFDYGKGRVFHTPLGHDVKAIRMTGVTELMRRGCVWAAGRELETSSVDR